MANPALRVLALSIGGALGVNARYWLGLGIERLAGARFPWGTLAVNASGSFAIGLVATCLAGHPAQHPWRLVAIAGFLGGYTTFSAFALETYRLGESGSAGRSVAYVAASVGAGIAAVALGVALGRAPHPECPQDRSPSHGRVRDRGDIDPVNPPTRTPTPAARGGRAPRPVGRGCASGRGRRRCR